MAYKKSRCPKGSRKLGKKCVKVISKKSPKKSPKNCSRVYTKKYSSRSSPPYPANECCGSIKKGNDGKKYVSRSDVKGICRWVKL